MRIGEAGRVGEDCVFCESAPWAGRTPGRFANALCAGHRASILECGGIPPLLLEDIEFLPRAFDLVCFYHPLQPREMPPHKAPRERGALQDASRTP
jgi:hypothetical protein